MLENNTKWAYFLIRATSSTKGSGIFATTHRSFRAILFPIKQKTKLRSITWRFQNLNTLKIAKREGKFPKFDRTIYQVDAEIIWTAFWIAKYRRLLWEIQERRCNGGGEEIVKLAMVNFSLLGVHSETSEREQGIWVVEHKERFGRLGSGFEK
jgi:hypothetical protein